MVVTRHGDRTPFTNIVNAKYKWKTGVAQLTPIGMNQEFQVGKKLRERYVNDFHLLSLKYVDDSIYTLSSNTNRTIVSAECMLLGLYPDGTGPRLENNKPALPNLFQPIPIRVTQENSGLIMVPYSQYLKILKKNIYNSKAWVNKEKELQPDFKKWTKILGNKITNLADVLTVGDTLIVARQHNKPLPKGLSQKEAQKIINLTSWGLATQFKSQKVSYQCGGKLVNRIIEDLENAATGKKPYKLVYYSGHDITILPILGMLDAPLDKSPGYASHLQIELYKKDNSDYIVKLRYNGKNIQLPIMDKKGYCTLKKLSQYVEKINKKYKC